MLTNLLTSAFGPQHNLLTNLLGQIDIFALVFQGVPPSYTVYERTGIGYSIGAEGYPSTTQENEPLFDISGPQKQYLHYTGTNKTEVTGIPTPGTPTGFNITGDTSNYTFDIITHTDGIVYYRLLNNAPGNVFAVANGPSGNLNTQTISAWGQSLTGSCFLASSNLSFQTPFDTGSATRKSGQFTPTATFDRLAVGAPSGSECIFRLPQLTETDYAIPDIPATDGTTTTVNQPALKLQAQDVGAAPSIKPFVSMLGTSYGLDGLFTGVDSQPAIGRVIFEDFTTYDLGVLQPLISTDSGTDILWIATDGTLTASDGTNTVTGSAPLAADTEYDFFLAWDRDEMWITINTTEGTRVTFAGSFPAIGDFLKYGLNNAIYHDVRNVLFDNDLISGNHSFLADFLASDLG